MSLLAEMLSNPKTCIRCMPESAAADLRADLRRVPIIQCSNVAHYLFEHTNLNDWYKEGFENLAPPFERFWMEFKVPKAVILSQERVEWKLSGDYLGALIEGSKRPPWTLDLSTFVDIDSRPFDCSYMFTFHVELDDDAHTILLPGSTRPEMFIPHGTSLRHMIDGFRYTPEETEKLKVAAMIHSAALFPMFLAISFMHCKNVTLKQQASDAALAKRNLQRGKPSLKYHVIEIEPLKQILRTEGRIETEGLPKALHICRGHFAKYAEDGPGLFGKGIHGRFWIPQHVRGSEKRGVVVSDYNVKAPKERA